MCETIVSFSFSSFLGIDGHGFEVRYCGGDFPTAPIHPTMNIVKFDDISAIFYPLLKFDSTCCCFRGYHQINYILICPFHFRFYSTVALHQLSHLLTVRHHTLYYLVRSCSSSVVASTCSNYINICLKR